MTHYVIFGSPWERVMARLALGVLLIGLATSLQPFFAPNARQQSVRRIVAALEQRRSEASPLSQALLARDPDDPLALALAAEAAIQESRHEEAIAFYERLPRDGSRWEFLRERGLGFRREVQGCMSAAERHLRRALALYPYDLTVNEHLGHMLQVEGRSWESAPYFFAQVRRGKCRGDELLGMSAAERFFRSDERLELYGHAADPPEELLKLAEARRLLFENRSAEAEGLLRQVLSTRPELGEAQGRLGRIIVERGRLAEFLEWRGGLPDEAREHPEVWFAQGLEARRLGQPEGAAHCFLEALARSPNHLGANVQIAGCLEQTGHPDVAAAFSRRGGDLAELEGLLNLVRESSDATLISKAAAQLGAAGRYWEAAGWCHVLVRMGHSQARDDLRQWCVLATTTDAPNPPSHLPARLLKRDAFSSPRWPAAPRTQVRTPDPAAPSRAWRFVDDAERTGLRFQYFEGTNEQNRLEHIFNVMGGGLAALDYDGDGWPDLYFAQANNWRDPSPQPESIDRLFRNVEGERFDDVTLPASLGDEAFSHGVAIGDLDQDGFQDVYVGNKGPNRLYRNNGDGTFSDISAAAGVPGNEWTTSSVFADFNGDGLPDLYVLNYTLLEETARKECLRGTEQMACTPDMLTAEHDRCYVNRGDGTFEDVSAKAGILIPNGKGLGVIAWDFGGDGRLGLFVANDTTPNFLFINQGADRDGVPQFREEGVVRGVAFDTDGNALASMGVAAGDVTGDGRIELFITNFFASSNALFSQRTDGSFDELTRPYDLRDPGFWMLGFGCQFADFDGDGWEDLVVTNGHVDQRSSRGDPDRMPPQLFQNLGGRRFAEVPDNQLGPFFRGRYLGRGLALLDWNRDGRTDFAVSHLHAPAALVTNDTPAVDVPVVVRLIARRGPREPIGATVTVRTSGRELVRLQTGGDGFLVTNEHRLHFAVPRRSGGVQIEVRWPHGERQVWPAAPAGCELLLIEGRSQPIVLRQLGQGSE